jgi:hypothetical protein
MARTGIPMQITAVDSEHNLFCVQDVFSSDLVDQILATPWLELAWQRQTGQESWHLRRCINNNAISWISQWHHELGQSWTTIEQQLDTKLLPYCGTAFWLDEPGFTCGMHTDGELPGSLHMPWIGTGTSFYWHRDSATLRYQVPALPNTGYIMINQADSTGFRKLLWHGMLTPVPQNTFRLTSYTWLTPQ